MIFPTKITEEAEATTATLEAVGKTERGDNEEEQSCDAEDEDEDDEGPEYLNRIRGDLLLGQDTYIVHQANCVTSTAAGIARQIFNSYPYANTYKHRTKANEPGTIGIAVYHNIMTYTT